MSHSKEFTRARDCRTMFFKSTLHSVAHYIVSHTRLFILYFSFALFSVQPISPYYILRKFPSVIFCLLLLLIVAEKKIALTVILLISSIMERL